MDGTYLAFGPEAKGRRLTGWLRRLQTSLRCHEPAPGVLPAPRGDAASQCQRWSSGHCRWRHAGGADALRPDGHARG
ncbi:MAG: hypothetical protein LC808_18705, partial [Actinobacteria bacterium]|nr:hypothetical protein [Actinomycetota bacterium]